MIAQVLARPGLRAKPAMSSCKSESVPLRIELPGRTTAFETSEVRPQVSGIIQQRLFTEGAVVKQGDLLYRIDPRLYESALNQARADLTSAMANAEAAKARAERIGGARQVGCGEPAGSARRAVRRRPPPRRPPSARAPA